MLRIDSSHIFALLIGVSGSLIAIWLNFPAAALTGSALAVTIAGLSGLKLNISNWLRDFCFVIIGVTIGNSVTPEVLRSTEKWPFSFFILLLSLCSILWAGMFLLQKIHKYDRNTALLASSPGHLSYVLSLTSTMNMDVSQVSLIQSVRLLVLTVGVPFIIAFFDFDLETVSSQAVAKSNIVHLAIVMGISAFVGWIFNRAKAPAAYLLGGMAVSAFAFGSGISAGQPPIWYSFTGFMLIGVLIGTRFSGITLQQLRKALGAGLLITAVGLTIALISGLLASTLLDLPLGLTLIAFAPGGVETMSAIAISMGVDPAYVAAHHVLRLIMLTFLVPWFLYKGSKTND